MTPTLNWLELEKLIARFRPELETQNLFVDRLIIPERARFPEGYIKGEWGLRLTSRRSEFVLVFSIRPRHPYLLLIEGKGPRLAQNATQSAFGMEMSKHLRGSRFLSLEALKRERTVVLWFTAEGKNEADTRLGLVLTFIPATPEAYLITRNLRSPDPRGWSVISRSRNVKQSEPKIGFYQPPDGSKAPANPAVRDELVADARAFTRTVEKELDLEAFEIRQHSALKSIRDLMKQARDRSRQSEVAIQEAASEPDWKRYGDLLKSSLPDAPELDRTNPKQAFRELLDFETGEKSRVPCDPKLSPQAQVEKFYQMARRKARRHKEAELRLNGFKEALTRLERQLGELPSSGDWKALEKLEREAGTPVRTPGPPGAKREKRSGAGWLGKTFTSKDGFPILIGRSKDENLELTFRHARGNDVWMHVRGKPGAHTIIPLHSGKSAPLETLLDAAALTVYYSGGENWGKTEVDYTFKKHVKRIKDSTEASYTGNKTLIVERDAERLKRLLAQNAG